MSAYTFAPIRPEQWPEALALWEKVFGVGAWLFDSLHKGTERRNPEHTRVAMDASGRIVSAVDVFLREMNDAQGQPKLVGGIGSVATLEEHRKHGLSGRLLEQAIEVMEREGCAWSFLFTGVHHHYERYGWFKTPLRYKTSPILEQPDGEGRELSHGEIRTFLPRLAELWRADHGTRPLAHRRTPLYWEHAIYARMTRPERRVLADALIRAYVVVQYDESSVAVLEAAGDRGVLARLLGGVALEALMRGLAEATSHLPEESWCDLALLSLGNAWTSAEAPWAMSRAVVEGPETITAAFAAPGAQHSPLDDF